VLLTAAKKSTGGMADDGFNVLYVVTFLAGGLVAIVCAAAVYAVRVLQRRAAAKNQVVAATDSGASRAWPDPEKGEVQHAKEEMKDVHITKKVESLTGEAPLTSQQLTQQLCDTLSSLLDEHISQKGKGIGLQAEGELLERMARLERQLAEVQGVREFRYPVGLRGAACGSLEEDTDGRGLKDTLRSSIADTQTPNSSDHSSASYMEDDLPGAVASVVVPPLPPLPPLQEEAVPPQAPPSPLVSSGPRDPWPVKDFGPTDRQCALTDPPERCNYVDEEESEQASLATLQRNLYKRDGQTTELHRQLREARQVLWQHAAESRLAASRLHDILADPSRAPAEQAEAISKLRTEVRDLSSRLADCREQEHYWSSIAKRQRAFFMQSERMSQEGLDLLKRHPAGEIFLAPPPVVLEGDEDHRDEPMWDVGTSHCNPYCVDSWPFEPNVLAARASAQPNLNRWDEGDQEEYEEDCDEDDDEHLHSWGRRQGHDESVDEDSRSPVSPAAQST